MALITPELAKEYAARSVKVRAERKRLAAEAAAAPPPEMPTSVESDEYQRVRLARLRAQLDRVDGMLACEKDTRKLRDLAAVAKDLEEQERRLSGRSLPPTLKAPAKPRARPGAPAPLD